MKLYRIVDENLSYHIKRILWPENKIVPTLSHKSDCNFENNNDRYLETKFKKHINIVLDTSDFKEL